jgi:hypothetical protein
MAIMDAKLEFSDAQSLTSGAAASEPGTNVIKMGTVKDAWGTAITNDIGEGNNGLVVNFQVAASCGSETDGTFKVYTHTTSTISAGTLIGQVSCMASGLTIAGTKRNVRIPAGTVLQYIGVTYSAVSSAFTGLEMDAWLGLDTETPST